MRACAGFVVARAGWAVWASVLLWGLRLRSLAALAPLFARLFALVVVGEVVFGGRVVVVGSGLVGRFGLVVAVDMVVVVVVVAVAVEVGPCGGFSATLRHFLCLFLSVPLVSFLSQLLFWFPLGSSSFGVFLLFASLF
jgi:hypothetical protein